MTTAERRERRKQEKENEKYLNKIRAVKIKNLVKLGIRESSIAGYGDFGFIDTHDADGLKIFKKAIEEGKYMPITWYCEGDTDYFDKGYGYVNRLCYGLRRT